MAEGKKLEQTGKQEGLAEARALVVQELDYRLRNMKRDAQQQAEWLTRRLAEADRSLAGGPVQSLGVLQGNAVSFDGLLMQIAALQQVREALLNSLDAAATFAGKKQQAHTEAPAALIDVPAWWPTGHYEVLVGLTLWGAGKLRDPADLEALIAKAATLVTKGGA